MHLLYFCIIVGSDSIGAGYHTPHKKTSVHRFSGDCLKRARWFIPPRSKGNNVYSFPGSGGCLKSKG